ncbi:MAG: GtrA family protein [Brevinematia bacterium]
MTFIKCLLDKFPALKKTLFEGIKFSLVGVMNTLVSWITFFSLFYFFKVDFRISNVISYILGLINSFLFNKFWTFKSKKYRSIEIFFFFLVFIISFSVQYFFTLFLKDKLGLTPVMAYISGNILYTLVGFFGNKYLTFRHI